MKSRKEEEAAERGGLAQAKPESMLTLIETRTPIHAAPTHANESLFTKQHSKNASLLKARKKPMKWSEVDTKTFFKCLEIFGMDFSMIKEVLSHKTQRQILRKFHREKKRDAALVERTLASHESNLIQKDAQCHSFLENVLRHTSDSDFFSDNASDDSLDKAVNKKLKLMIEKSAKAGAEGDDEAIQPLDYYLKE